MACCRLHLNNEFIAKTLRLGLTKRMNKHLQIVCANT